MKTTFIRTLVIAVLASSISAFAETGAKKTDDVASACDTTQQSNSKQKANVTKDDVNKSQDEDQQQRDQDRLLLGIYG
jgi:hypothetical protein